VAGNLYVGTSGFAYPGWSPQFYPPGLRPSAFLDYYARQLSACELNNTFYQQPSESKVAAWLAATPVEFRFAVKAQKGGSMRALLADPQGSVAWLTPPYRLFGERLGAVLYRVPANVARDDERLGHLLAWWPRDLPLVMEFQDPSWHVDETFELLRAAQAALCTTELPESESVPPIIVTGSFIYLRLRRDAYDDAGILAWANRIAPFLDNGLDAFVFFRHDETGRTPGFALELRDRVLAALGRSVRA
jgi:uncharacterized protein YecE (DUF72 family)